MPLLFLSDATPVQEGRLVDGYDRFVADVQLPDGLVVGATRRRRTASPACQWVCTLPCRLRVPVGCDRRLCVEREGPRLVGEHGSVNVHAETWVDGRGHRRLERRCRYVARPPVATERLSLLPDGRVRLAFGAPWRDGRDAVILAPMDFVARLCALVPPPRFQLVRYAGTLAAGAACRSEVVPGRPAPPRPAQQQGEGVQDGRDARPRCPTPAENALALRAASRHPRAASAPPTRAPRGGTR